LFLCCFPLFAEIGKLGGHFWRKRLKYEGLCVYVFFSGFHVFHFSPTSENCNATEPHEAPANASKYHFSRNPENRNARDRQIAKIQKAEKLVFCCLKKN
jgi:hypothetical protein